MALAGRLRRRCRSTTFAEHVRRPDDALPGQPRDQRLARDRAAIRVASRASRSSRWSNGRGFVWAFAQLRPRAARLADELARRAPRRRIDDGAARTGDRDALGAGGGRRRRAVAGERRGRRPTAAPPAARRRPVAGRGRRRPLPTWTSRPVVRRGRARSAGSGRGSRERADPAGPQSRALARRAAAAASTGSTCGSLVVLVVGDARRSARSASPSRTRCTSTRSTTRGRRPSSSRTGATAISHDIYEWTHPHLAKYAMAGGLVAVGRRPGQRDERPRRAGRRRGRRAAPRRPVAPDGRAGERRPRRDRDRGPRPTTSRRATLGRRVAGRRAPARSRSTRPATGSFVGDDDGADRRRSTSTSIGLGGARTAVRRRRSSWRRSTHPIQHAARDRRRRDARRRRRRTTGSSTLDVGRGAGHRVGRAAGHRRPRAGRHAARRSRPMAGAVEDPAAVAPQPRRPARRRRRRRTRRGSRSARRTRPSIARHRRRATTRTAVDEAIADGRLPGIAIEDVPRVAVATARRRRVHRPGDAAIVVVDDRARRRRPRPGLRHRPRRPEAVRPTGRRPTGDPAYARHRDRRRRARRTARRDRGTLPAARPRARGSPTTRRRQQVHVLGRDAGRDRRLGPLDGLRHRAARATRSTPTPRLPRGFEPVAWALDVEPRLPDRRPPAAPRLRRRRARPRRSTLGRTRSPGACRASSPAR